MLKKKIRRFWLRSHVIRKTIFAKKRYTLLPLSYEIFCYAGLTKKKVVQVRFWARYRDPCTTLLWYSPGSLTRHKIWDTAGYKGLRMPLKACAYRKKGMTLLLRGIERCFRACRFRHSLECSVPFFLSSVLRLRFSAVAFSLRLRRVKVRE